MSPFPFTAPAPVETAPITVFYMARVTVLFDLAIRLLGIKDAYSWHQRVWQLFPGRDKQDREFLSRVDIVEEAYRILVVSKWAPIRPDWCPSACFEVKTLDASLYRPGRYRFSLIANPTRKVAAGADGVLRKHGRRLPVAGRENLLAWLDRKAATAGFVFQPEDVQALPRGVARFHKEPTGHGSMRAVEFSGVLTVTDPHAFFSAMLSGFGSGKGFGFGLLLVAPLSN